jgi:hypothetical protein
VGATGARLRSVYSPLESVRSHGARLLGAAQSVEYTNSRSAVEVGNTSPLKTAGCSKCNIRPSWAICAKGTTKNLIRRVARSVSEGVHVEILKKKELSQVVNSEQPARATSCWGQVCVEKNV